MVFDDDLSIQYDPQNLVSIVLWQLGNGKIDVVLADWNNEEYCYILGWVNPTEFLALDLYNYWSWPGLFATAYLRMQMGILMITFETIYI